MEDSGHFSNIFENPFIFTSMAAQIFISTLI